MIIQKKTFKWLMALVSIIAMLAVTVAFVLNFTWAEVTSGSMIPTMKKNDVVLVKRTENIKNGDCVLFFPTTDYKDRYVKRAIAQAGDTIAIQDGAVILNGEVLDEPYIAETTLSNMEEYTVPEGCFFAMGDNRNHSYDSRFIGPIPYDQLIGVVIFKI